uniref:lipoprotein LpqH n=1 Tax=Rhodococcus erythropolis TaxID=1833 RepID=UPI002035D63C|nr:lipoprotein LpqH [Rhodococcus erythropolis]
MNPARFRQLASPEARVDRTVCRTPPDSHRVCPAGLPVPSKDGNTFVVTGEGIGARDKGNPTETSSFEITFACESVIGG